MLDTQDTKTEPAKRTRRLNIKLQHGSNGRMATAIRAETVREDGSRYNEEKGQTMKQTTVVTKIEKGEADRGLVARFWVHG